MKFVHMADMHFDTSFTQLNNSNLGSIRRLDQRKVFQKIINYIKQNDIEYFFIAGDLYEHKYIKESTIEYINKKFKEIENTKIFITPGNHDPFLKNSFYNKFAWNKNVHIFNSKISLVEDENCRIYGYGFDDFYYTNPEIERLELPDKNKINILITHATLNGTNNIERQYNAISKATLEKIGFEYVALGHIHKLNYKESKNIIYPGSPISMGFDELGEHGIIVGEIEEGNLKIEFIPLDETEFKIMDIDISDMKSIEDIADNLNSLELAEENLYEIYLQGTRSFEIDKYNLKKLINNPNIIKLKDKTKMSYDLEKIAKDKTLKGLFVQEIMEKMTQADADVELLEHTLEIGLDILEK